MPPRPLRATIVSALVGGVIGALTPGLVLAGGLAPLLVAGGVAIAAAWLLPGEVRLPGAVLRPGLPLLAAAWLTHALAASDLPPPAAPLALAVPAVALGLTGRRGVQAALLGALLALLTLTVALARDLPAPPTSALLPMWAGVAAWGPGALVLGLTAGVAALLPRTVSGARGRPPGLLAGLAVLAMVAVAAVTAAAWELAPPGWSASLPWTASLSVLGVASALPAVVASVAVQSAPRSAAVETAAWAAGLSLAGATATAWVLHALLPLGAAAILATATTHRPLALAAACLALLAAVAGFPPLPHDVPGALGASLLVVALAWRLAWPAAAPEAR